MRVLVTGMGGELGTRVALMLESDSRIAEIYGLDVDPPRRRLRRSEFKRIDPRDRRGTVDAVRQWAPTAVIHLGIYEPHGRSTPATARERSISGSLAALGAAVESTELDRIVTRSGIEVYGRRRNAPLVPDEATAPDPTAQFGHTLLRTEAVAASAGESADVPVTALRFAPLVGPHFPSPLGRYLRLPLVPVSALADPPFSLVHQEDAADAIVAALHARYDGPLNIVGPGAVTASQAARMGRRLPVPLIGPEWRLARRLSELAGSPVPDHVLELMHRGRTANGAEGRSQLALDHTHTTRDVVKELYEWAPVTHLNVVEGQAA
ncbi:MAG TPA: NAD-dependent epimerase/dehydratase family protein [Acidimicrobiales bacterium]